MKDNIPSNNTAQCLTDAFFPELPGFYRGKVRDTYSLPDGRQIMIATDRQSAFDQVLAAVPFKGQVLNQTAKFWFEATKDICPNHVISYPDPNAVIVKTLKMMPIEVIVRDYLTGSTETSIWTMYKRGERFLYGHSFDEGMVKNQKLPKTIITPTTKGDRDVPITGKEIVEQQLLSQSQWDELTNLSLQLFSRGKQIASEHGLILVDTKYEFGLDENNTITVADELHTPDSSRYWKNASYEDLLTKGNEPEGLDKEFLRLWIREHCDPYKDPIPVIPDQTLIEFSKKYQTKIESVTGETFTMVRDSEDIYTRIQKNLSTAVPDYF